MVQTSDGGYALAGSAFFWVAPGEGVGQNTDRSWLLKADSSGNKQWEQFLQNVDSANSVVQTNDSGYALVGSGGLIKTNSSGNTQWNQTLGGVPFSVIQTNDGGYAIAGETLAGIANPRFGLIKTDAFGNMKWSQTYSEEDGKIARSVIQTSDGGYVLGGVSDYNGYLVKTDLSGNVQWNQTFNGLVYSVIQTKGGEYIVAGTIGSIVNGNINMWLAKTDSTGNMEWNQSYSQMEGAQSVIQANDGGYALAGNSGMVKADSSGNLQWSQTLNVTACSVVQSADGGYILAGSLADGKGGWLTKIVATDIVSPSPTVPEFTSAAALVWVGVAGLVAVALEKKRWTLPRSG